MREMPLPYRFFALLHKAVFASERHANTLFAGEYSHFSEFLVLNALTCCENPSQHNIAEHLNITPAAVSRRIDILAQRGFAKRNENPQSRRTNSIVLTAKGKAEISRMQKILGKGFKAHVDVLSEKDMRSTCKVLETLLHSFNTQNI